MPTCHAWRGGPFAAALALLSCVNAQAGWNSTAQTIEKHATWIYTPSTSLPSGKHPLMIVLHGCAQTHDEIKEFGNLVPAAEAHGMVMAVPSVGARFFGNDKQRCWDYNGASDGSGHIGELVALARKLLANTALNVEPRHVYIAGLSSGAAMALDVACKAPDVFAGVAAMAGPSVGSSQFIALQDEMVIPSGNAANAIAKCKSLAGGKAAQLATQVANVAYGDMDRNGPRARFNFLPDDTAHPGQYLLVSIRWSLDNAKVFQSLLGTGALDAAQPVQNGLADVRVAKGADGRPRLSLLVAHDVGHAWPAGSGAPNSMANGGRWIAQSSVDYPGFVAGWLIANNARLAVPQGPEIAVAASVSASSVRATIVATAASGATIAHVDTELLKASAGGAFLHADAHANVTQGSDGRYTDVYDDLADGRYKVRASATDSANRTTTTEPSPVQVIGHPPAPDACQSFTDNNFNQVVRGRAHVCSFAFVCAKGSGDNLGLFNIAIVSTVKTSSAEPGVFRKGGCPEATP